MSTVIALQFFPLLLYVGVTAPKIRHVLRAKGGQVKISHLSVAILAQELKCILPLVLRYNAAINACAERARGQQTVKLLQVMRASGPPAARSQLQCGQQRLREGPGDTVHFKLQRGHQHV